MLPRLLLIVLCAAVGGVGGFLVGAPPSDLGSRFGAFVGVGIGLVTGLGIREPSPRRIGYGLAAAVIGAAVGFGLGREVQVGARLGAFVGAWLGFAVGAGATAAAPRRP